MAKTKTVQGVRFTCEQGPLDPEWEAELLGLDLRLWLRGKEFGLFAPPDHSILYDERQSEEQAWEHMAALILRLRVALGGTEQ